MHSLLKNFKLGIFLSAMIIVASPGISYSQLTIWDWRTDSVDNEYNTDKISSQQWSWALRETAGSVGMTEVWVKDTGTITPAFLKASGAAPSTGVSLYIAKKGRPNKYGEMTVYLLNNSDSDISIPRHDATVRFTAIKEEVYAQGRWLTLHHNVFPPGCGNGRFTAHLNPGHYLKLESDARDDPEGSESAMYRIALTVSGRVVTSNEIKIRLFKNQLARIVNEGTMKPPQPDAKAERELKIPLPK